MDEFYVYSQGPEGTAEIATIVAPFLRLGDVVLFTGDLATGKTHFIKALALALGSNDYVTSPTYTIANFYNIKSGSLLHVDAYRLSSLIEFRDLGIEEYMPDSITVVEWGEKISRDFPYYLSIQLEFVESNENFRRLVFSGFGDRWSSDIKLLKAKLSGFQQ